MTFTDAHSGSAVCTPTRYGILTGRYAWRTRLQSGVLNGYSLPLIAPGRLDRRRAAEAARLPHRLRRQVAPGPGLVARPTAATRSTRSTAKTTVPGVDYARPIANGPTTLGFDEYFGISASLDMPPYLYIRDDRTVGLPTTEKTYIRKGPAHVDFEAVDVLPTLTRKAVEIHRRAGRRGEGRRRRSSSTCR